MNIAYYGEPALTLYAVIRTTSGYVLNPTSLELEQPVTLDHLTYSILLSEDGVATGSYSGEVGGGAASYVCEYWQQLGSNPDRAIDRRLGAIEIYFDGEKEWETESLSTIQSGTTTTTTDIDLTQLTRMVRELYNLRLRTKV